MIDWKDISSYSKSDKERKQNSFQLMLENHKAVLHKHIHYGNEWLLTSMDFGFDKKQLGTDDLDTAKSYAIKELKLKIYIKIIDLQKDLSQLQ